MADVHEGASRRVGEPRRFKFGRRPPGFGPRVSGCSCASAAFLLFLHGGEDLMSSLAVLGLLGVSSSTGMLNRISPYGDFSCKRMWQKLYPDPECSVLQVILKEKVKELNLHEVSTSLGR